MDGTTDTTFKQQRDSLRLILALTCDCNELSASSKITLKQDVVRSLQRDVCAWPVSYLSCALMQGFELLLKHNPPFLQQLQKCDM